MIICNKRSICHVFQNEIKLNAIIIVMQPITLVISVFFFSWVVVALMQCNNNSYPQAFANIAKSIAQDGKFVIYLFEWKDIYLCF